MKPINNLSWEEYALKLAQVAALKSKDPYIQVGCCLLRHDNSVASLGFNGFPSGMEEDWNDRNERRKYVVHSETNALRYVRPEECYLAAVTLLPCNDCLKSLASYGIKKIVYEEIYKQDPSTIELAKKFGIELIQITSYEVF
jgi:dCMP deaminase